MSKGDRAIRWGAVCALLVVTGIALVISYGHARDLVEANGERGLASWTLPLTVDGLIATTSLVLVDAARRGQKTPVLAWFMLCLGIAATLAANVLHGLDHGPVGAAIAGWPAVVATGCFELVIKLIRGAHRGQQAAALTSEPATGEHALPHPATVALAATDGGFPSPGSRGDQPVPDPLVVTARDRFAKGLASGDTPSIRAIRRELSIGHPRARRVQQALADGTA